MPVALPTPRQRARDFYDVEWPFDPSERPGVHNDRIEFVLTLIVAWNLEIEIRSIRNLWSEARILRYTQPQIREEVARRHGLSREQLDKLQYGRRYLRLTELQRFLDDPTIGPQLREMLQDRQGVLYGRSEWLNRLESAVRRCRSVILGRQGGRRVMHQQDLQRYREERTAQLRELESAIETLMHVAGKVQGDIEAATDSAEDALAASPLRVNWSTMHTRVRDRGLRQRVVDEQLSSPPAIPFAAAVRASVPEDGEFALKDLRLALGFDRTAARSDNILDSTINSMVKRGELTRVGRGRYRSTPALGSRADGRGSVTTTSDD